MSRALNRGLIDAVMRNDVAGAKSLLDAGANPNAQSRNDRYALFLAAKFGRVEIVKLLVSADKIDVNTINDSRNTALHIACKKNQLDCVKVLCGAAGIDIEQRNLYGSTALDVACMAGHTCVVELLLFEANEQRGANPNARNLMDQSAPLYTASAHGSEPVVDLLLKKGADVHHKNAWGETALHEAVFFEHVGIIKKLLRHGADADVKNNKGETPRDLAFYSNNHALFEVLHNAEQYEMPALKRPRIEE